MCLGSYAPLVGHFCVFLSLVRVLACHLELPIWQSGPKLSHSQSWVFHELHSGE